MTPPAVIGETCRLTVVLGDADIRAVAAQMHDANPVHHDVAEARAAGYPGLIACGPHTAGIFMGMTATHFSSPAADGRPRSMLGLGFDIRFRAAVNAGDELALRWTVTACDWKDSMQGWITQVEGDAHTARGLALSGTGSLLVRLRAA